MRTNSTVMRIQNTDQYHEFNNLVNELTQELDDKENLLRSVVNALHEYEADLDNRNVRIFDNE